MLVDELQKYLKKKIRGGERGKKENFIQWSYELCFTLQILMSIKE